MFHENANNLAFPIKQFLDHCFSQGQFAAGLKISKVILLHKVALPGSQIDLGPIAITSIMSRIMERTLIKSFVARNYEEEIEARQHGFRVGGSTENALIRLQKDFRHFELVGFDYVWIISLEFSKASDKLKYNLLVEKLSGSQSQTQFMILFTDFFTNRKQTSLCTDSCQKCFRSTWEWFREEWVEYDFSITISTTSSQIRKPRGILISLMTRPLLLLETSTLETKSVKAYVRSLNGAKYANWVST